jgi:hypothetical protein
MASKEIPIDLDLVNNKIIRALLVSLLEKSKLELTDLFSRLSTLILSQESVLALGTEEFNLFCRDNLGSTQVYVNGQSGFVDIFGSDGANFGSTGFTTIAGSILDIQSDNNISIIANGTDIIIQSTLDQIQIDGALGITFLNGGGTSPVRSEPQFIVGLTPTAFNAWLSLRNGSVSRAALALEAQPNYTGAIQAGLVWNSNVNLSLIEQQLLGNKSLSGTVGVSTGSSNTVGNTAVATNITGTGYTFTIPANSLTIGKRLRISFRGRYSTGGGGSQVNLRLQSGANTVKLVNVRLENNQASRGFSGEAFMNFTAIGAGGQVNAAITALFDASNGVFKGGVLPNISNSLYSTIIAQSINFNWQWVNPSATVSVTFEDVIFEVLN